MDRKPIPLIPEESYKTQRVEIYINELQARLHLLRKKHDAIFTECCEILQKIQQVSTHTITKQQEIGRIINEFEEFDLKTSSHDSVLQLALNQQVGEVKRLRAKFEKIFQDNLDELVVQMGRPKKSRAEQEDSMDVGSFYSCFSSDISHDEPESLCLER